MKTVKIKDRQFELYIDKKRIAIAVQTLAKKIREDLKNETPLFIGILNGSFIFVGDLMRAYGATCEVSFIKLASYDKTASTGKVRQLLGIYEDLTDRTVVVLEDIIDTGATLQKIYDILDDAPLKKLKMATLFFKPSVFKKELHIDYVGMEIPDEFIVGYGMDYDGQGRNLPEIYKLSK